MNTRPLSQTQTRSLVTVALLAGAALPLGVFGQAASRQIDTTVTRDVRVTEPTRPMKKADRDFFEKAAKAGHSEVAISRVAAARTSNPEVRRLAQMMIEDHEKASDELASLAANCGVTLPAKDLREDKWEKRDAKTFDKDYLAKMVSDHEDVVKLFEKQAKDGNDVETVAFARKYLPTMQAHLQHATDLKRALSEKPRR
jgi:putative membrane protein